MADNRIKIIYNAFEPNVAAASEYYRDCREARGGDAIIRKIKAKLLNAENEPLHFLFTGHLGCGKSSELKHLARIIERDTTFFPVYIDFEDFLDTQDVQLEDIFLVIISKIASRCAEKFEIRSKRESYSLLSKIFDFVTGINVKGEVGLPFDLAKLSIEKLPQNKSLRLQVRQAIETDEKKSLFSELNDFITEVEYFMKEQTSFTKLLIIADSLEKIRKFEKADEGIKSQYELFIDRYPQLTSIVTHIVYTVPLSLYRSHYGTQLPSHYGGEVFVLPMVKIHKRGDFNEPFETGIKILTKVVEKRLAHHKLSTAETFEDEAFNYLIKYSGGNIRSLIRFVQEAVVSVDALPIDFPAARQSVREAVRSFAASIKETKEENHWKKLAELELNPRQQIKNGDDAYAVLLGSTAILEYMNGDESDADDDVWYAVNPAVRRTLKFQEEVEILKAERE
jgi:energy-coupling factor transporter ATP-binding protein EcfA2